MGSFSGTPMIGIVLHRRLPWFALAAIVGMVSLVGEASACPVKAARPCCVTRKACCCKATNAEVSEAAPDTSQVRDDLAAAPASCECRSNDSPEPARRPESRTSGRRADRDRGEPVVLVAEVTRRLVIAAVEPSRDRPPDRPVYLVTSRLLI